MQVTELKYSIPVTRYDNKVYFVPTCLVFAGPVTEKFQIKAITWLVWTSSIINAINRLISMLLVLHCLTPNSRLMQTITALIAATIFIPWVLWTWVLTTVSLLIIIFNDELSLWERWWSNQSVVKVSAVLGRVSMDKALVNQSLSYHWK